MENLFNAHKECFNIQNLLEEAIESNETSVEKWTEYKKELEEVKVNMVNYSEKLTVPIMIPLCSKAMIPGQLVHTNEVMINLGDNWFSKVSTKQAVGHCERKIQFCDEMLKKYEKEKEIIDSRLNFPASDTGKEIIEPYVEEDMAKWREEHREKEKKYHKVKRKQEIEEKPSVEEEELWRKLDELELQEELEDQLLMNDDEKEINEDEEDLEEDETESDETENNSDDDIIDLKTTSNRTSINDQIIQHVPDLIPNDSNILFINHSNHEPLNPTVDELIVESSIENKSNQTDGTIKSIMINTSKSSLNKTPSIESISYKTPSNIYEYYIKIQNIQSGNTVNNKLIEDVTDQQVHPVKKTVSFSKEVKISTNEIVRTEKIPIQQDLVLKNITEQSTIPKSNENTNNRPLSKFKSSRKS